MIEMRHTIMALLLAMALVGCSQPEFVKEREQQEKEGWTYVETIGIESKDATLMMWMSSDTAREAKAFGITNGKKIEKTYSQDKYFYRGCAFMTKSGDSFVLVFRKDKPPPATQQATFPNPP